MLKKLFQKIGLAKKDNIEYESPYPAISFYVLPDETIQIVADWPSKNKMDKEERAAIVRRMTNMLSYMCTGQLYPTIKESLDIKARQTNMVGISQEIDRNIVEYLMNFYTALEKDTIDRYENDTDVIMKPSEVFRGNMNE